MGYVDYFLIVWDYIHYAKSHGIPVGPGRGSGAGSMLAYAIGITDIDPIKYGSIWNKWDLHIHSDASDGKMNCQEIIDKAKEEKQLQSNCCSTDHKKQCQVYRAPRIKCRSTREYDQSL